jgi:endonuclease-3 related protein
MISKSGHTMTDLSFRLMGIFSSLYSFYGPQKWWPAETPFEVAIGAILTQNTNWLNVEKAIRNLKSKDLLNLEGLNNIPIEELSLFIKPSGYYNIKAKRIRAFLDFMVDNNYRSIEVLKKLETDNLRRKLLSVYGIGFETADSILLYALEKPVFVIDAYTKRILSRHGIMNHKSSYKDFQDLFHSELASEVRLFNEYHALLVRVGKEFCKSKPACGGCPLSDDSHQYSIGHETDRIIKDVQCPEYSMVSRHG